MQNNLGWMNAVLQSSNWHPEQRRKLCEQSQPGLSSAGRRTDTSGTASLRQLQQGWDLLPEKPPSSSSEHCHCL